MVRNIRLTALCFFLLGTTVIADESLHRGIVVEVDDAAEPRQGGVLSLPARGMVASSPTAVARRAQAATRGLRPRQEGAYNSPFAPRFGRGADWRYRVGNQSVSITQPALISALDRLQARTAQANALIPPGGNQFQRINDNNQALRETTQFVGSLGATLGASLSYSTAEVTSNGQTMRRPVGLQEEAAATFRPALSRLYSTFGPADAASVLSATAESLPAHRPYLQTVADVLRADSYFTTLDGMARPVLNPLLRQAENVALSEVRSGLLGSTQALGFGQSGSALVEALGNRETRAAVLASALGTDSTILTDLQARRAAGTLRPGEAALLSVANSEAGQAALRQVRESNVAWNRERQRLFNEDPNATPSQIRQALFDPRGANGRTTNGASITDFADRRLTPGRSAGDREQFQHVLRGMALTGSDGKHYVVMERDGARVLMRLENLSGANRQPNEAGRTANQNQYLALRAQNFTIADPNGPTAQAFLRERDQLQARLDQASSALDTAQANLTEAALGNGDWDWDSTLAAFESARTRRETLTRQLEGMANPPAAREPAGSPPRASTP